MWREDNNRLVYERDFQTQTELAQFLVKVARLADQHDHHPDITVTKCSHLKLELFTHTLNTLTDQDRKLAKEIESLTD